MTQSIHNKLEQYWSCWGSSLQTFSSESHIGYCATLWGPDILRNVFGICYIRH